MKNLSATSNRLSKIAAGFIVGALALLFIGCGPPPPEWETVNALDYTMETMEVLNRYSGDVKGFREYFKGNRDANRVFAFLKNSHVEIKSGYGPLYPGVILRSHPNHDLVLEQGLYVSERRKNEALVSLDNINWYSTRTDFDLAIDNFKNLYHYDLVYRPEERVLIIEYILSSGFNETQKKVFVPRRREVIPLKKGMVFKHPNKKLVNFDLTKRHLYIPEGTIVSTDFRFAGNLMTSGNEDGTIKIDILRDIYLYYKKLRIGISFDGKDWSAKLRSFKIAPLLHVAADADDHINVIFGLYVTYED